MMNLSLYKKQIAASTSYIQNRSGLVPTLALFLGTGLGSLSEVMSPKTITPYSKIPSFPRPSAFGQQNRIVIGKIGEHAVLSFEGRFHAYEGHSFGEIGFPVRVAHALGVRTILCTNIAGSVNLSFKCGDIVAIEDHINLMGSPLAGPHEAWMGERFVDMSEPYDKKLIKLAHEVAKKEKIRLKEGVYAAVMGPALETRAEYRYLKKIGADLVGMSTVPEVLVARQLGMKVLVLSVVSDECNPDHLEPINVPKILSIAKNAQEPLTILLSGLINPIANEEK